jgi:replication initiator protein RepSA
VPAHLVELAAAAMRLQACKGFDGIGRWAHMLGFRGHPTTKSRKYSVTLGELRRARLEHQRQLAGEDLNDTTPVIGEWSYAGMGYISAGDATLAAAIEAEHQLAREELLIDRQTRAGP